MSSSSLGASKSANFPAPATSASASSFPLTYSNGANLNPKAGLHCQLGASGRVVCQQVSNSISATGPAAARTSFPLSINSTTPQAGASANASATGQLPEEDPSRVPGEIAAAGLVGGAVGAAVYDYYNALQDAAAGGYGAVQDFGEGIELQEDRNPELETAEFPTEGPTEAPSAMQTSYPQSTPSSNQALSTSRASSNSSIASITPAPSARQYSQDWIMPNNSVDMAAISNVAAILQSEFQSVGVAGLISAAGANSSNVSNPLNGSVPLSISISSISSGDFITLSEPGSSSSQPVAVPNASPAAKKLPQEVSKAKATAAWSAFQYAAAKAGKSIPTSIVPADCFSTGNGLNCCFDQQAASGDEYDGDGAYVCNQGPVYQDISGDAG
ncbi:hypothetical protein OEA41_008048 [Lepraria neglecta]|uniref:Uncharacterized protein n=1 Tax=Lepraria neglecta TaxID=209136 RepID=A0AAD9ZF33_9LECA|nr:hypothetical protein OEA41_008048 [Lepraria neglecta]